MMEFVTFAESSGARLLVVSIVLSCITAVFFPPAVVGGFSCGALAFCLAVVSLEQISQRALQLGNVRSGIRSGFLWVAVKFCGPAAAIFYGIWRGFSIVALILGIFTSLAIFVLILWLLQGRGAVGPKV
jgi:hypothetical protein